MQIEIKVGSKSVYLRGSDKCYEICEMRNIAPKKGEEAIPTLCPEKYFSTLQGALSALLDMKIRACDATTLAELRKAIMETRKELTGIYDLTVN